MSASDDTTVLPHKKPELLVAFFSQIPDEGCDWPADRRALWLKALTNALEWMYQTVSDDTTQRDLAGMEIVPRRHYDEPSVDLHDTTDAVADYCPHGICSGCCEDRALQARIDDLEAMCASYVDTIGKCNAENNALEVKLAAVMSNRELYDATRVLGDEVISLRTQLAAVTRERDELRG